MVLTTLGDLARGFALNRQSVQLRQSLTRLGSEVSTGRVADPVRHLGGHVARLSQIEHDLVLASGYRAGVQEARFMAETMQHALKRVADSSGSLVNTLVMASTDASQMDLSIATAEARSALETTVSALNIGAAGRQLFSGTAVTTAPLPPADDILAQVRTAIAPALTPSEAVAALDAFFDTPGGGFETLVYRGSAQALAPVDLGAGETADLDLRADHAAIRSTLKYTALAALADDPALTITTAARRDLIDIARDGLLGARDTQATLQAGLGVVESRIAGAAARIEAQTAALDLARNALLAVDPYAAATELEAVRLQLETVYSITARLSNLSLARFLS